MRRETELFFDSIMSEDRDVTDLLTANYTFVDERLAKHYGIPNIIGTRFRRVTLTDETRFGLLGQASVLTVTSLANRTSPVSRGKWILEQILGVKAPVPPPNVPPLKENTEGVKPLTVRDRLEQHRSASRAPRATRSWTRSASRWRASTPSAHGASATARTRSMPRGNCRTAPRSTARSACASALVDRSDVFVRNFTQNLLTYALGRGVEYYDMPAVRAIARDAAANQNRFSSFVLGIVNSVPFQMRRAEEVTTETAADAGRQPQAAGERRSCSSRKSISRGAPFCEAWAPRSRCRCWTRWCPPDAARKTAAAPVSRLACIEMVHGAAGSSADGIVKHYWSPAKRAPTSSSRRR